jgi:hypothetical protein
VALAPGSDRKNIGFSGMGIRGVHTRVFVGFTPHAL